MEDLDEIINATKNMSMNDGLSKQQIKDTQNLVVNLASLLTKEGDMLLGDLTEFNRLKAELGTAKGSYDELVRTYQKAYRNEDWQLAFKIWAVVTRDRLDLAERHCRLVAAYQFIETNFDLQDALFRLVEKLVKARAVVPKIAASYVPFEYRRPYLSVYSDGSSYWSQYTREHMEYDTRAWLGRHAGVLHARFLEKLDGWRIPGGVHFPFYKCKERGCAWGDWTESEESFKIGAKFVAPKDAPQFGQERGQSKLEPSQSKPEPSQSKPEPSQSKPESSQSKPESSQSKPESSQSKPESSQSKPESSQSKSSSGQSKPSSDQSKPSSGRSKPAPDQSKPAPVQDAPPAPRTISPQALVDEWRKQCAPVLENRHSTLTEFPKPPAVSVCERLECLAKESTRALACACVVRSAFNRVKDLRPAKERLKWHPDRFAGCEEKEQFQRCATEIFAILQAMHEGR